jgi:DNA-binding transcriptional MerR regulator
MRGYRIREFAELAGVTVKALHHYDRLGLLSPRRAESGYRMYAEHDLERLEQIVALKFLGLPLRQVKSVLEKTEIELAAALRAQRKAIEKKQALLARAVCAIQAAEESMAAGTGRSRGIAKNHRGDRYAEQHRNDEEILHRRSLGTAPPILPDRTVARVGGTVPRR